MPKVVKLDKQGKRVEVEYTPYQGQLCLDPHLTVPDQTLTPKEIFDRHVTGRPIMGNVGDPQYLTDDEAEAFDFMNADLAEKEEYLDRQRQRIDGLQTQIDDQRKAAAAERKAAAVAKRKAAANAPDASLEGVNE